MRKPILAALAVLLSGTIVLPGCFYAGPPWWEPDDYGGHRERGHDERRERHREWREPHGALIPPQDDRRRHDDRARRGHDNDRVG